MKKKFAIVSIILAAVTILFFSCTKEVAKLQGPTDAQMIAWSLDSINKFYFQNDSVSILAPLGGSPHGPFKMRFNSIVKNALGSDGRVIPGSTLPDSSFIVKLSYTGNVVTGLAAIFKLNGAWSWGEYSGNGSAAYTSVAGSSGYCISCHGASGNRDQTLVSTYH